MALSSPIGKVLCMAVIAMVVAAPAAEALSCGDVSSKVAPCINYLKGTVAAVPAACCNGIKSLNSASQTPADRQTACKCLKSAANSISGLNDGLAAGLPGKCGVNVPYKISRSTNCNR